MKQSVFYTEWLMDIGRAILYEQEERQLGL